VEQPREPCLTLMSHYADTGKLTTFLAFLAIQLGAFFDADTGALPAILRPALS
jgi:hypothetical protein